MILSDLEITELVWMELLTAFWIPYWVNNSYSPSSAFYYLSVFWMSFAECSLLNAIILTLRGNPLSFFLFWIQCRTWLESFSSLDGSKSSSVDHYGFSNVAGLWIHVQTWSQLWDSFTVKILFQKKSKLGDREKTTVNHSVRIFEVLKLIFLPQMRTNI